MVGGIFICDPQDWLRGRNSDFGMPALLPAFDRLVDAHSSISPRTRPGRRKSAATPTSLLLAYSMHETQRRGDCAAKKSRPLAQAEHPKLSATPIQDKTPARAGLWISYRF